MSETIKKIAQFFSMTRRERIGTLVVAVVLAIAVIALVAAKHCARSGSLPPGTTEQVELFKQQVEAIDSVSTHHQHHKKPSNKRKDKQKSKEHKSKANRQDKSSNKSSKRLDEVPSF